MAAAVMNRVMGMSDLAVLIGTQESPAAKHGPYNKKAV
jgi:hypothetical protein